MYAKYNRVDLEDEQLMPYDEIVVQPFTATDDPTPLGIKPIPNIQEKIKAMLDKYIAESIDIQDVEYEEYDLEEGELFVNPCLNVGTTIAPVEPTIRCIFLKTKGAAILSVLPVRRPATITVVLAPIN